MSDQSSDQVDMLRVEVAYALPEKQHIQVLSVPEGTTAMEAVTLSKIDSRFDDLQLGSDTKLGIFGKAVPHSRELAAGERVEIYRPLKIDPKEVRKQRAAKAKAKRDEGE